MVFGFCRTTTTLYVEQMHNQPYTHTYILAHQDAYMCMYACETRNLHPPEYPRKYNPFVQSFHGTKKHKKTALIYFRAQVRICSPSIYIYIYIYVQRILRGVFLDACMHAYKCGGAQASSRRERLLYKLEKMTHNTRTFKRTTYLFFVRRAIIII